MLPTALVADPVYRKHQPGPFHPERPERYDAALQGITAATPADRLLRIAPRRATDDEIRLCHTPDYIETVKRDVADGVGCLSTGDTDVCPQSYEVALMAAGGLLQAADAIMTGQARNAFAAVRPPGHHACADRGMGFCVFNNIAIAARYLQRRYDLERIVIVDWDVHHGNGTQAIFDDDPTVFYFSTHQYPCYPGTGQARETGSGPGRGFTLNWPVAPGSGRPEILAAFREQFLPAMRRFKPEAVLISAGFDARQADPIGNLCLTDDDFAELTRLMLDLAHEYAGDRILSALEGGYALSGLAAATGAHVATLAGVGQ